MRAIVFPEYNLNPNGPILRGMIQAAQKNNWDILPLRKKQLNYKLDLRGYDSAVIFTNKPQDNIYPIIKGNCKVGWWMCDLRSPNALGAFNHNLDAIFICNLEFLDAYKEYHNLDTYYMPQSGFDDNIISGRTIEGNLVFIGGVCSGYHKNRSAIIKYLQLADLDFWWINGEGTTKDQKWIYRNTDYSLAISPPAEGYTSNRLYNILASKGFCISLYFPGIEDLFENHKHLVWFKQKEEIPEIMAYYDKNKSKAKEIKEAGYKIYKEKHTAEQRLFNMFDILEGKIDKFYGLL